MVSVTPPDPLKTLSLLIWFFRCSVPRLRHRTSSQAPMSMSLLEPMPS